MIEAVGADVSKFKVGDSVFAFTDFAMGCYVEYICMAETGVLALKPSGLSFDEAAALSFGGTTALHFLHMGNLQSGERILINGASGAVGIAAVQLAKHFGAQVTAVCGTANVELLRTLGADEVIDYTSTDFMKNGQTYHVIFDAVGNAPFSRCQVSLTKKGRLLMLVASLSQLLQIPWVRLTTTKKTIGGAPTTRAEDLRFLAELSESGKFKVIIDRRYPLAQAVAAHRYVDTGHKRGNVVLTLKHDE